MRTIQQKISDRKEIMRLLDKYYVYCFVSHGFQEEFIRYLGLEYTGDSIYKVHKFLIKELNYMLSTGEVEYHYISLNYRDHYCSRARVKEFYKPVKVKKNLTEGKEKI